MAVCEVQKSAIHGNGLFATEDIAEGVTLFQTHFRKMTGLPCEPQHARWLNMSPNCQYNHSKKNANCQSKTISTHECPECGHVRQHCEASGPGAKVLVTLREIQKGEELLVDYTKDWMLEQPKEGWSE